MKSYPTIKLSEIARQEALEPSQTTPAEIKPIHAPKGDLPEGVRRGVTIAPIEDQQLPQGPPHLLQFHRLQVSLLKVRNYSAELFRLTLAAPLAPLTS
jgi:hypothetical protein